MHKAWKKLIDSFILPVENMRKKIKEYEAQGPKQKKNVRIYGLIVILILSFFVFSIFRGVIRGAEAKREAGKPRIIPVYVQEIEPKDVIEQFKINGNVMAENSVNIVPDIGGKLIRYVVQVGDTVVRGQTIAYIDPSKPGTSYNLNPVSAPLGGVISSLPIELGNTVTTTTVVAQMGDLSKLKIETYVPERFVEMIHIGKEAAVSTVAFPHDIFKARIYEFAPTLDPVTRTLLVKLQVENGQDKLLSGMFAELVIDAATYSDALAVPPESIITRSGQQFVYVVTGEAGTTSTPREVKMLKKKHKKQEVDQIDPGYYDGSAKLTSVTTGIQSGNNLIIKSGISAGDRVIYSGQELLSDKGLVRIMELTPEELALQQTLETSDGQSVDMTQVVNEPLPATKTTNSATEEQTSNPTTQTDENQKPPTPTVTAPLQEPIVTKTEPATSTMQKEQPPNTATEVPKASTNVEQTQGQE